MNSYVQSGKCKITIQVKDGSETTSYTFSKADRGDISPKWTYQASDQEITCSLEITWYNDAADGTMKIEEYADIHNSLTPSGYCGPINMIESLYIDKDFYPVYTKGDGLLYYAKT